MDIYGLHAEMCKVFSSPKRLELIDILRDREMTVTELSERLGMSLSNLSQHLSMMKNRGILASRKSGNQIYYRVANPKMLQAFDLLREILLERLETESELATRARR